MSTPTPALQLSTDEAMFRNSLIEKAQNAQKNRDKAHPELDDMTYPEYYMSNRKKDLSYLEPRKNSSDIQIVTGTTREKDTTLLSTLLNMNLEPDVTAFNAEQMMIAELGENMADLVLETRHTEDWLKKRPIIYREMIAQGDVFVQELFVEEFRPVSLNGLEWKPTDAITKFELREHVQRIFAGCAVRRVPGINVYLGNIRTEYIEDQEEVFIYVPLMRSTAKALYGRWERWKYVPTSNDDVAGVGTPSGLYREWNLTQSKEDEVGQLFCYLPKQNRFNILINGIPMLPYNYPLDAISPTGELPLAQGKLEPISGFAYSKSQPAKTKVDQAVLDEFTKLMVEKTRQSAKPPKGNTSKKVFSSAIFDPGKITNNIREGQIFDLLQSPGVTGPEFSFFNHIKENINEKSVNDVYSGASQENVDTLGQSQQMIDQQMLKLGHALDGVVNLERRLTWNRLHNVLRNYTKPVDRTYDDTIKGLKDVYRSVSVKTTLHDGVQGIKLFRFTKDAYPDVADQEQEEAELEDQYGMPTAIVYLDPDELRMLRALYFIQINPVPKQQDKLSLVLFVQNLRQGYELFGTESFNLDYAKQRYAVLMNENFNKLFKKADLSALIAPEETSPDDDPAAPKPAQRPRRMELKPVTKTK